MTDRTKYSKDLPGTTANWDRTSRFDMTRGCLGISQWEGKVIKDVDRVLLSKQQVAELRKFLGSGRNPKVEQ